VAAGAVDHDTFVKLVDDTLRQDDQADREQLRAIPTASYTGGDYRESRDLMDAQVLIGFEGRAYQVRDFYCSQLLANILGGGMSSRLFQEVREKRGLCYSVYAFHWGFSDSGIFGVHAATGGEIFQELIPVILSELAKAAEGVDEQEINRSRAQVRSGLLMSQESPAARASQIARQMLLFGRPVSNDRTDGAACQHHAATAFRSRRSGCSSTRRSRCRRSDRWQSHSVKDMAQFLVSTAGEQPRPNKRSREIGSWRRPVFRFRSRSQESFRLDGERTFLRYPVMATYPEWSRLREASRTFLEPWEPRWAHDDLTRSAFRYRIQRYDADRAGRDGPAAVCLPQIIRTAWSVA
jgi:hypothetical protein